MSRGTTFYPQRRGATERAKDTPLGVVLSARPGVGAVTLALLFGLYSMIYGFSQITAGVQLRQLGRSTRPMSEVRHAA